MPADASIYGNLQQPRINTPFENLSTIMQLRNQQQAAQGLLEQRQAMAAQERERTEALQQKQTDIAAIDAAMQQGKSPDEVLALVPGHLRGMMTEQFQKADEYNRKAKESKTKAETDEREYFGHLAASVKAWEKDGPEAMVNAAKVAIQVAKSHEHDVSQWEQTLQQNPQALPRLLEGVIAFAQGPQKPEAPTQTSLAVQAAGGDKQAETALGLLNQPKPAAVGSFEDYLSRYAGDRKIPVEKLSAGQVRAAKVEYEAAGRAPKEPKDERIVQVMGPSGTPIWVRESDAVGKPAAQAPRAVTGAERQSLAFYNRAKEAAETVSPLEDQIGKMSLPGQTRLQYAPNFLQSDMGQSYRQAQRAFTEARLRKESGAAIPTSEYENDARTYFAQPGDTSKVLEQKRKARDTVLNGLAFSSGRAYDEFYGEPRPGSVTPGSTQATPASAAPTVEQWVRDSKTGKMVKKGGT